MEPFALRIAPGKMTAYLTIRAKDDSDEITIERTRDFLRESGIIFGRNEDTISEMIEQKKWGEEFMVASGRRPENGVNGKVKYYFDPNPKGRPTEREDGSLDFYDLRTVQCVSAGERVAELIPPTSGEAGTNIFGEQMPAMGGKPARILRGKNTSFFDDSKTVLVADVDGNVKLRPDGAVEVPQLFTIHGDIDLSTGNIDVKGNLIISGDVKAGFKISASGNINVGGSVEDAYVEAGGSVIVKGGFLGEGNGLIKAGGDVHLKFIYRQQVKAGGDIEIFEEATQSHLEAEGRILIRKGKGILVGGSAMTGKAVEANIVGNEHNTKTEIMVAARSDLLQRIEKLQKDSAALEEKLDEVARKMSKLMSKKKKVGLNQKDEDAFRLLDKLSADIERSMESVQSGLADCEKEMGVLQKDAYIYVSKTVYPGVTMKIAGLSKFIENEREATRFRNVGNEIIGIED